MTPRQSMSTMDERTAPEPPVESPGNWRSRLKKAGSQRNGTGPYGASPSLASAPVYKPPPSSKLVNFGPTAQELAREKLAKLEEEARLKADLERVERQIKKAEEAKRLKEEKRRRAAEPNERKRREAIMLQRRKAAEEQRIQEDLEQFRQAKEQELHQKALDAAPEEHKKKKSGKKTRAAIKIQALGRGFIQRQKDSWIKDQRRKEKELKQRLKDIRAQTKKDLATLEEKVQTYKQELDERARAKREKYKQKMEAAETTRAEAETLKKENAQYREKNEKLKTNTRNLRINNLRLEKSNQGQEEYMANLKEHHARCVKDNARLAEVEEEYRKKVEELKESLAVRTAYAVTENRTKVRFRTAVKKFMKMAEKSEEDALKLKILQFFEKCEKFEETAEKPLPFEIPEGLKSSLKALKSRNCEDSDSSFWDSPATQDKPKASMLKDMDVGPPLSDDDDQPSPVTTDEKNCIKKNGAKKTGPRAMSTKEKNRAANDSSDGSSSSDSDADVKPSKKEQKEPAVKIARPKNRPSATAPKKSTKHTPKNNGNDSDSSSSSSSGDSNDGKKMALKMPKSPTTLKKSIQAPPDTDSSESSTDNNRSPIKHQNSMLDAATKLTGGTPPQKPPLSRKGHKNDSDSDGWSSGDSDSETTL